MNRGSKYSLITLGVLTLASLVVGVTYLMQQKVGANPEVLEVPAISYSVPLKQGTNDLINGEVVLTLDRPVIGIRGSLMTPRVAQSKGIIGEIKNKDGKELGNEVDSIGKDEKFTLVAPDTSASVAFYPERLGP